MNQQLNKLLGLIVDDNLKSFERHYHLFAVNTWTDALKETLIIQAADLDRAQHLTLILSDITSFKMDYSIKTATD